VILRSGAARAVVAASFDMPASEPDASFVFDGELNMEAALDWVRVGFGGIAIDRPSDILGSSGMSMSKPSRGALGRLRKSAG
jgi:hypothetical protein